LLLVAPVLSLLGNSASVEQAIAESTADHGSGRFRELFTRELLTMTSLLWIGGFLTTLFLYVVVNWLPSSLRSVGYSLQASVLAISLFNMGGIAGALLLGALMDRYGALRVMPIAFGLAGLSMAAVDLSRSVPALLLAASFMTGLAGYGGGVSYASLTLMLYPQSLRITGVGSVVGIGRLGAAIGPLAAGFALSAGLGIGRLFYFAAAAAVLVMLCLIILPRVVERVGELAPLGRSQ
jgi:AAHS family 4-hydroxybenzoate transporter-like MFS transporter